MMTSMIVLVAAAGLIGLLVLIIISIKSKMQWRKSILLVLQVLFAISFISCIAIALYYINYYMGDDDTLRDVYIALFFASVVFFVLILIFKLVGFFTSRNK